MKSTFEIPITQLVVSSFLFFSCLGEIVLHNCSSLVVIRKSYDDKKAIARWVEPTAQDYKGNVIKACETPGYAQGDELPVGVTSVIYRYTSNTSSEISFTASCDIKVIVAKGNTSQLSSTQNHAQTKSKLL